MLRVLAFLLPAWFLLLHGVSAQAPANQITINGDDLPFEIEVAPADADNFGRRLGQLPRREDFDGASGAAYTVTSDYWSVAVPLEEDEEELGARPAETGTYFPEGGFVRIDVGGSDAWVVLNLRQRAILDRYINLAKAGLITGMPSTIDVLAGALNSGEAMGVSAGADPVERETAVNLFSELSATNPAPVLRQSDPPGAGEGDGFWIIITLLEGRDLRYYYDGATLTEAFGTERYDASSVSGLLLEIAPASLPQIEQQEPAGSLLWWPITILAGTLMIAAAIWVRRRFPA